jgi:hypothetical protein
LCAVLAGIGNSDAQLTDAGKPPTVDGFTADFNMSTLTWSTTYQWLYFPSDRQNNIQNRGRI